ncbi:MAG: NADH-quinone oxidoreductase subunit D-related protein [bacterium]
MSAPDETTSGRDEERLDGAEGATLSSQLGLSEAVVEIGPGHPGLRRTLALAGSTASFLVSLDDERIVDLEVEIGLGHRGFEKEVESGPWLRALPYVGRLGYAGGLIAEVAFCSGIEALAALKPPDRAVWLRMLGCELARATDHFSRLAAVSAAVALPAAEQCAQQGALQAARLLERVVGGGPFTSWVRPGGVRSGLPADFEACWAEGSRALEETVAAFDAVGVRNPTCVQRLRDVAPLAAKEALAWSVTGPALRATGVAMDRRRDRPCLAYDSVDFDVPIGERGDGYDRLRVVVEEIRQSLRIADQSVTLLGGLGAGALAVEDPCWRGDASDADASPDVPILPAGEVEVTMESSTGELGFLLVSDGSAEPRRVRCRAPSFFHAQALPGLLRGAQLEDLLPTVASMHLVSGECDR